jgi:hypothetical protein
MANAALSRRVGQVVGYPPLCARSDLQRRELHEALLDADSFETYPASAGGDPESRTEPTKPAVVGRG